MNIIIHSATEKHARSIAELYSQLGYHTEVDYIKKNLAHTPDTQTFVACSNEEVVGVIEFHLIKSVYRPEPAGHISALVVSEQLRSQGIGSKLLGHVEKLAKKLGCAYLEVTSNRKRERAHAFYERHGLSQESHCYFRKMF